MQPSGNILIVDDNLDNLQLLSRILIEQGYDVRVANNGEMAVKSSTADPPDLILLDVVMPDLDGYEVCRQLKTIDNTSSVPIIFVSAIKDIADRVKCFAVGGVDYIPKPFQIEEVVARVNTHLTVARMKTELESLVRERTEELTRTNLKLRRQIAEREQAEKERAGLQEQLLHAQKMEAIGQLAGGIAHDFNNILTALFYYIDSSKSAVSQLLPEETNIHNQLDALGSVAKKAESLTRRLLIFSRRDVAQPNVLDLDAVIGDMNKMLMRLITENIKLEIRRNANLDNIFADAGQIEQIVMNLVINASDAMPHGGHLVVNTLMTNLDAKYTSAHPDAKEGPHVLLTVQDNGQGMTPETIQRIFEPFYTTKPVGKGTGLGLATAYTIVKQCEGHITVDSQPGRGTTFNVFIPVADKAIQAVESAVIDNSMPGGNENILICEDEETVRNLLTQMLSLVGYNVLAAGDGPRALELAQQTKEEIPLLITDVVMPGINGRILSEKLQSARPGVKTLFISGYTSNIIAHHGIKDEGIEFLEKPFDQRTLLHTVRRILDKS